MPHISFYTMLILCIIVGKWSYDQAAFKDLDCEKVVLWRALCEYYHVSNLLMLLFGFIHCLMYQNFLLLSYYVFLCAVSLL